MTEEASLTVVIRLNISNECFVPFVGIFPLSPAVSNLVLGIFQPCGMSSCGLGDLKGERGEERRIPAPAPSIWGGLCQN